MVQADPAARLGLASRAPCHASPAGASGAWATAWELALGVKSFAHILKCRKAQK